MTVRVIDRSNERGAGGEEAEAPPRPAPEAPEPDKMIVDLRREVLEARNLIIKSDNALKSLHAEMKVLTKRQESYERRAWIASGTAYGAFALIACLSAAAVSQVRTASVRSEAESAQKQAQAREIELKKVQGEIDAGKTVRAAAIKIFDQMGQGEEAARRAAVEAHKSLDRSKLSPLEVRALEDRARQVRDELAGNHLNRGRSAYKRNEFAAAATALSQFLAMDPEGEDVGSAAFYLGAAKLQLKDSAGAIAPLEKFIQLGRPRSNLDYAHVILGDAYERTGAMDKALNVYRKGAAEFPNSQFAGIMRGRAMRLSSASRAPDAPGGPKSAMAQPPSP